MSVPAKPNWGLLDSRGGHLYGVVDVESEILRCVRRLRFLSPPRYILHAAGRLTIGKGLAFDKAMSLRPRAVVMFDSPPDSLRSDWGVYNATQRTEGMLPERLTLLDSVRSASIHTLGTDLLLIEAHVVGPLREHAQLPIVQWHPPPGTPPR